MSGRPPSRASGPIVSRWVRPAAIACVLAMAHAGDGSAQTTATDDASPLSLADLEAYRAALAESATESAREVSFRDLWSEPQTHRGQRVTVEGRLVRRFRQDAIGTFPPLVEAWLSTPGGNLMCIAYPWEADSNEVRIGTTVRFSGRYLKRVEYQASDQARLAPLIVGGGAPSAVGHRPAATGDAPRRSRVLDWAIGLIAATLVLTALAGRVLNRPSRRRERDPSRPEFLEPGPPAYNDNGNSGRPLA